MNIPRNQFKKVMEVKRLIAERVRAQTLVTQAQKNVNSQILNGAASASDDQSRTERKIINWLFSPAKSRVE